MSIQGQIIGMTVIPCPDECATCKSTGLDPETNWDACPRCHGAVKGTPVVYLILGGQQITGQKRLRILNPSSYESDYYRGLIGVAIWSTGECVMIGKTHWATRIGYTAIKLVQRPVLAEKATS